MIYNKMESFKSISVLFYLVYFLFGAECFPSGGPYKSCANLYPKHHTNAQSSPPPYSLTVNTTDYEPGDIITVTLKGLEDAQFKGFMVRANRLAGDTEDIVGEWFDLPNTANARYWYPKEDNQKNCVTHTNAELKSEVILHWKAPDYNLGDIQFYATFVKSYDTFWVFVPSSVVKGSKLEDPKFNASISTASVPIDLTECGDTKGCMVYPMGCLPGDCQVAVTYKTHHDGVDFEAMAPQIGYLTFAISEDKSMGHDETVTCISTHQFESVQHGFNPSYYNDRHRILGFTNIETDRIDGTLQCKWTMPYVNTITHLVESADGPPVPQMNTFDLRQHWHVFLAYGPIYEGADVLSKHKVLPLISRSKVNFQEKSIVTAEGLYMPMKIHAIFMMLGFILLIGISVVVARHYRETFSREVLGVKAWFQLHRALMIAAVVLILIGFVVIFATLKKWSEAANAHAVLGTLSVALLLIQILSGFLRPSLQSKKRVVFNWMHRISGKLVQILSAVTMLLSLDVAYLNPEIKDILKVVLPVWIIIQLVWELLILEVLKWSRVLAAKNMETSDVQEMSGLTVDKSSLLKRFTEMFLRIHFMVFCFILVVLVLIVIVWVFIS